MKFLKEEQNKILSESSKICRTLVQDINEWENFEIHLGREMSKRLEKLANKCEKEIFDKEAEIRVLRDAIDVQNSETIKRKVLIKNLDKVQPGD